MLQWREEARFSIFLYLVITSLSYQIIKGNLFKRIFLNVSLPILDVKKIFLYQRYRVWCFWWNWLNSRYVQFHFKRWAASNASLWQFCSLYKLDQIHSHFAFLTICLKFLRKNCFLCKVKKKIRFSFWRFFLLSKLGRLSIL